MSHVTLRASAIAHGTAGGGLAVAIQLPTATVSGTTRGYVSDGVTLHSVSDYAATLRKAAAAH